MSETSAAPQLTGNMFLYERPELITREKHGDLGLKRPEQPYAFCARVRAVPLNVTEIGVAARHYPVVFSGGEDPIPLAVFGVVDETNLFVGQDGTWELDAYIPAYVRRYPFAFAGDEQSNRLALVIDAAYPGVTDQPEQAFFSGDKPSEAMEAAIKFCQEFEGARQATMQFAQRIKALELITNQVVQFTPAGETQQRPLAEYNGVDEQKLRELSPETLVELRDNNYLPFIYAQMLSMSNWRALLERRARRFNVSGGDLFAPGAPNPQTGALN